MMVGTDSSIGLLISEPVNETLAGRGTHHERNGLCMRYVTLEHVI